MTTTRPEETIGQLEKRTRELVGLPVNLALYFPPPGAPDGTPLHLAATLPVEARIPVTLDQWAHMHDHPKSAARDGHLARLAVATRRIVRGAATMTRLAEERGTVLGELIELVGQAHKSGRELVGFLEAYGHSRRARDLSAELEASAEALIKACALPDAKRVPEALTFILTGGEEVALQSGDTLRVALDGGRAGAIVLDWRSVGEIAVRWEVPE